MPVPNANGALAIARFLMGRVHHFNEHKDTERIIIFCIIAKFNYPLINFLYNASKETLVKFYWRINMLPSWLKVTFWGGQSAGKTELIAKIRNPNTQFNTTREPTVGVFFYKKIIEINNEKIRVDIWDISGDPMYNDLIKYSKQSDIEIYCVDLSNPIDKVKITKEIEILKSYCPSAEIIVVGTKNDVEQDIDKKIVQLDALCKEQSIKLITTSAKNNVGIDELNQTLAEMSYKIHNQIYPKVDFQPERLASQTRSKTVEPDISDKIINEDQMSLFNEEEDKFKKGIEEVDILKKLELFKELRTLKTTLFYAENTAQEKKDKIKRFQLNCHQILGSEHSNLMKAVISIVTAAAVTLLAWLIGFSIGLTCSAWIGPAAFITAFLAGNVAATAVVATGGTVGIGAGALTAYSFFNTPTELTAVNEFTQKISTTI